MEIHAPEHPVHTWKDILLHLAIVTVGILIAIVLDSVVEWSHHRELAEEARANIRSEMQVNRDRVQELLKSVQKQQTNDIAVITLLCGVLAHKKLPDNSIDLSWTLKPILDSGWTTAQSVGALSYLPYQEVKRFAEVYQLQGLFVNTANAGASQTFAAIGGFAGNGDPRNFPDWEVKNEITRVQEMCGTQEAERQLGVALAQQ